MTILLNIISGATQLPSSQPDNVATSEAPPKKSLVFTLSEDEPEQDRDSVSILDNDSENRGEKEKPSAASKPNSSSSEQSSGDKLQAEAVLQPPAASGQPQDVNPAQVSKYDIKLLALIINSFFSNIF